MTTLPAFNYPSTIAWVDDDALFLKAVTHTLGQKYILNTFNSPANCLNFFSYYTPLLRTVPFLRRCDEHENYGTTHHLPVDFNVTALTQLRNNPERHSEISVMVVDYNMPGMTGLELCRKLQHLPMKKILLTGEVESQAAVDAFNEGVIDRFIRKDNADLASEVQLYLDTLTLQYFKENTKALLSYLDTDQPLPMSDPVFITFFNAWCKENNIREYFLLDKQGNFYLIDENDNTFHFIVHTDKTLSLFVNIYHEGEKTAAWIESVVKREKIPFFGMEKEPWQVPMEEWSGCFYSSATLEGREKYYWSVVK